MVINTADKYATAVSDALTRILSTLDSFIFDFLLTFDGIDDRLAVFELKENKP